MNGFYRLTRGTYAQFGLPLPWPERTIDSVLAHLRRNGGFEPTGFNACNVLDVVHPLMLCARQTGHRAAEITEALRHLLAAALRHHQPGRGFAFSRGEAPGLQGTEMWLSIIALILTHLGLADARELPAGRRASLGPGPAGRPDPLAGPVAQLHTPETGRARLEVSSASSQARNSCTLRCRDRDSVVTNQ